MPNQQFTNEELARHFLQVMSAYSGSMPYLRAYRAVNDAPFSFAAYYEEHGSLKDVPLKNVGEKSKNALELILERGIEEAARIIEERKIADIRDSSRHRPKGVKGRVSKGKLYRHDLGKYTP